MDEWTNNNEEYMRIDNYIVDILGSEAQNTGMDRSAVIRTYGMIELRIKGLFRTNLQRYIYTYIYTY